MRCGFPVLLLFLAALVFAQDKGDGPTNEKAQKTYREGIEALGHGQTLLALDCFKKANKQDGGHCMACQRQVLRCGLQTGDWKAAETAATGIVADAQNDRERALAHYNYGMLLTNEALAKRKDEIFERVHDEMAHALSFYPKFPSAYLADGVALAHMKQDDAAKNQFEKFVAMVQNDDANRGRALRFISEPELARARMAPAFVVSTLDGRRVSLDDLKGKVVLLDFWATWCGPCRSALPHMQKIARKFQDQPLVILSVSLDNDEQQWKDFVSKNEMTWLQYRDGGFKGPIASLFGVEAIPQTFTIDSDGILQDQHIGDASLEGKLKKLIERARQAPTVESAAQ